MRYIPQGWDDSIQAMPAPALPLIAGEAQEEALKEDVRKFQDFYRGLANFSRRVYMDCDIFLLRCMYNHVRRRTNEPELSEDWFLNVVARCSQDWA